MTVRPAWLLPEGQTREDTRLAPVGTYAPESEMRSRGGVIAGGDPLAATGAGPMALQIGVGRALVQGTDAQGAYPIAVTAPEVLTFTDGNAQFARIDSVIARVYDSLYDTEGQTVALIEVVQGEASATPQPPALPAGSLRLWDVTVPAGVSAGVGGINWGSALADRRSYTTAYGGIVPRGSTLAFDGAYDGQYRDTGGVLERWSAARGVWETYRPPAAAPVTATGSAVATPAAGWSLANAQAIKTNGMITVRVQLERTGPDYGPASSEGNLVDLDVCTITPAWRPNALFGAERMPFLLSDMFGDGAATIAANTGLVVAVSWGPNAAMIRGRLSRIVMTYPA